MEINTWSKTLLTVYNQLEKITDTIDNIVLTRAINSHNFYTNNEVLYVAEKILSLTQRKIKLINLKVLVDEILSEMEEDAKILIFKYLYEFNTEKLMYSLNLSERSVYRKVNEAVITFSTICEKKGFSCEKLYEIYKDEGWIIEVYNNIAVQSYRTGRPGNINFFDEAFLNRIYKSYKKPPKIFSIITN